MLDILYTHVSAHNYFVITYEPLSGYITLVAAQRTYKEWRRMASTFSYHPESSECYVKRFRETIAKTLWLPPIIWADAENALYLRWRQHKKGSQCL